METFVNDTVQLTIDADIDVSGYSDLQIRYRKPDGTTGCWAAALYPGTTTYITYTCVYGDLDVAGEWLIQGIALDTGVRLTGRWNRFKVLTPLMTNCTTAPPTTAVPTTAAP